MARALGVALLVLVVAGAWRPDERKPLRGAVGTRDDAGRRNVCDGIRLGPREHDRRDPERAG